MNIDKIIFEKEYDKMIEDCKIQLDCQECKSNRTCCKYKAIIKKYNLEMDEIHPEFWTNEQKELLLDIRLLNS